MANDSKYKELLHQNAAVVLATHLKTKSGASGAEAYNWIELRKKLINADGKYSVETTGASQGMQAKFFPQASYSPVGNRFYIKATEFEAFCSEKATEFFEDVQRLSIPEYLLGWELTSGNMNSVGDDSRYHNCKEGSRLVGYPLHGNGYIQEAYVLQMGDTAMTLRNEFSNSVIGLYNPQGVTAETLTLAGNFLWVVNTYQGSNLYSHVFDSPFSEMFSFDFKYSHDQLDSLKQLKLLNKEHETLIRLQSLRDRLNVYSSEGTDKDFKEYYIRVFEIMHDRASRVADSMLVGIYKARQSGFKNTCMLINAGNYDLDQAIEIATEAAQISRG
jgi:hypothetical protein